jgi:hypothetical protein
MEEESEDEVLPDMMAYKLYGTDKKPKEEDQEGESRMMPRAATTRCNTELELVRLRCDA